MANLGKYPVLRRYGRVGKSYLSVPLRVAYFFDKKRKGKFQMEGCVRRADGSSVYGYFSALAVYLRRGYRRCQRSAYVLRLAESGFARKSRQR